MDKKQKSGDFQDHQPVSADVNTNKDPQADPTYRPYPEDSQATGGMVSASGTDMGMGIVGSSHRLREPKLMKKGLAYEFDKAESQFSRGLSAWRSKVKELEKLLSDTHDSQKLRDACDEFELNKMP